MAEDPEDKKDEFKLDAAGEAEEYISLDQARVLAIQHARDNPDFYGRPYARQRLAWEVISQEETEDFYEIRLSYRPAGRFRGEPGVEQITVAKTGTIELRQILDEPAEAARRGPPRMLLAVAGLVAIGGAVVAALFAAGIFDGEPAAVPTQPVSTATATRTPPPTVAPASTVAPNPGPAFVTAPRDRPTPTPSPTPTVLPPTPIPTPSATPLPPTPTATPSPTPLPPTPTPSATPPPPSPTATPSPTPVTPTPTATLSPTPVSPTPTATLSPTAAPPTPTATASPTPTPQTPTPTPLPSTVTLLFKWGKEAGPRALNFPIGLVLDTDGRVYVADTRNHQIQVFGSSGLFANNWGSDGTGDGQFQSPQDVAVDSQGRVYVADTLNHRVQVFNEAGLFLFAWGTEGSEEGQF